MEVGAGCYWSLSLYFQFCILYFGGGGGGGRSRLLVEVELVFCILHFVFCILVVEELEVGAGCCWRWSSG